MRPIIYALATACMLALAARLHSQSASVPLQQQLLDLKQKQQKIIETQTATLQKIEELDKQAQQLKFLGKRT